MNFFKDDRYALFMGIVIVTLFHIVFRGNSFIGLVPGLVFGFIYIFGLALIVIGVVAFISKFIRDRYGLQEQDGQSYQFNFFKNFSAKTSFILGIILLSCLLFSLGSVSALFDYAKIFDGGLNSLFFVLFVVFIGNGINRWYTNKDSTP